MGGQEEAVMETMWFSKKKKTTQNQKQNLNKKPDTWIPRRHLPLIFWAT